MAIVSLGPTVQPTVGVGTVFPKWRTAVYMKETWTGGWVHIPYLRALSARYAAFPGKSTAQLRFDYGSMTREDRQFFWNYRQRGLHDYFICIKALPSDSPGFVLWTGVVPAHAFQVFASKIDGTTVTISGNEILTAHGFEYFLARRRVNGGWVYDADASPYTAVNIGWAPSFNERHPRGAALLGNRSKSKIVTDAPPISLSYGFGSAVDGSTLPYRWSVRDIIEYLLEWSNPSGGAEPLFVLAGPDQDPYDLIGYLDGLYDVVPQEGRSVWELLKKLLDRRRGIGAVLSPSLSGSDGMPDGSHPVTLYVFSMTDVPSQVGNFTFPANPFWVDLTLDQNVQLQRAIVEIDSLNTYDEIVVEGERVVSCFTAEINPGTGRAPIEPAWPAADETAYKAADDDKRSRKNDRWERVYRMFRLPDDFDWSGARAFNPAFDDDGNIQPTTIAPFWNQMHRLLDWLPIRSSAAMAAESVVPGMTRPLVFCETFDEDGEATGKWVWVESPPINDRIGEAGENVYEKADLTIHDREGLVEVRYETQHYLARNHFDPDPDQDDSRKAPVFDYEHMVVTMAVEADSRPRVRVATQVAGGLVGRTLTIRVPGVQVWIVGTGSTAIALNDDSSLAYYTGSGVERDDTDQLRAVAALAKAVYGKRRAAIRMTELGLWATVDVGTMIRAVMVNQAQTIVNAVLTEISWDCVKATTTVQTGFLDLDTRRVR
jgi:hypothetical protein